jgi:hypothetical protein
MLLHAISSLHERAGELFLAALVQAGNGGVVLPTRTKEHVVVRG